MPCTLAIDQGTHASRALVFDDHGNEIAKAVVEVDLHRLDRTRVEQSAPQLIDSVSRALREVLAAALRAAPAEARHDASLLASVLPELLHAEPGQDDGTRTTTAPAPRRCL